MVKDIVNKLQEKMTKTISVLKSDLFSFEFGWNHNLISTIDCINGFN